MIGLGKAAGIYLQHVCVVSRTGHCFTVTTFCSVWPIRGRRQFRILDQTLAAELLLITRGWKGEVVLIYRQGLSFARRGWLSLSKQPSRLDQAGYMKGRYARLVRLRGRQRRQKQQRISRTPYGPWIDGVLLQWWYAFGGACEGGPA
jgi:hypothetical protein